MWKLIFFLFLICNSYFSYCITIGTDNTTSNDFLTECVSYNINPFKHELKTSVPNSVLKERHQLEIKMYPVDTLQAITQQQDDAINGKINSSKSFSKNYKLQQQLLDLKSHEIISKKKQIYLQDKYLENQKRLIEHQDKILESQKTELNNQDRINILFIITGILFLGFLGYIIKMSIHRRKLIERLKINNKEIVSKSKTLERQNKELEQFAYIASHDLQEPLHTVTSFADFMIEDYGDKIDDEGLDNLKYMKQGCVRMELLIKSLLDYSRIGNERKLEYINSRQLIGTIIQDFNALLIETKADINFGTMPMIYAYPTELRMLFQNIISNAIKFKKPNTTPRIFINGEKLEETQDYSHRWKFKIEDNGIGIPAEHQKTIFEIFKRLHTRENFEGTGIGLAHCKKVVMFHHGDIWVSSTVGVGTTFNFTIQFNPEDYSKDLRFNP